MDISSAVAGVPPRIIFVSDFIVLLIVFCVGISLSSIKSEKALNTRPPDIPTTLSASDGSMIWPEDSLSEKSRLASIILLSFSDSPPMPFLSVNAS